MARLGTLKRHHIPFALHSDYTMAPALPLNSAWVAATRENEKGEVVGPHEIVPLEDALRAITIDAAYVCWGWSMKSARYAPVSGQTSPCWSKILLRSGRKG